ncbi:MAG: A/G-specific adenine glycosylase [Bryobacterales bacterium]|nr:A/G-specific adenine glycosylase [Bryobacterales bacterium]
MAAPAPAPHGSFAQRLIDWYRAVRRDLPWRRTSDPYRIWVSEIMLQQTRVAAVIPYYERFLSKFPTVEALAAAPEQHVLAAWSGLGYYSRARNLQRAAQQIVKLREFPQDFGKFRELPGVGDYTAAAVSSIAFNQPHAAVDGNVLRVLSRHSAEPGDISNATIRRKLSVLAQSLLHPHLPGDFNQAMMELGATVCLPRDPQCLLCPVALDCQARLSQRQKEFPVKSRNTRQVLVEQTVLLIQQGAQILLWQRPEQSSRMAGFWELPDPDYLQDATIGEIIGTVRHAITIHDIHITVRQAHITTVPHHFKWFEIANLHDIPLSTIARKALRLKHSKQLTTRTPQSR